jgi:lipoyl-dependent peroxiredoxin
MKLLYTAHAATTGGRNGHTQTNDKKINLDLASPGTNKPGTNPEQLFAAGYSACFGSAVEAVAKKYQVPGIVTIKADVSLNTDDQGGYFIGVVLDTLIADFNDEAKLANIVRDAHQMCPYSKATRGNIEVTLKANGKTIS